MPHASTAYNPEALLPDGIAYRSIHGGRVGKTSRTILDARNELARKECGKHYPMEWESDRMRLLALSSITDSCSFILLLVTFIDNTYRDYE